MPKYLYNIQMTVEVTADTEEDAYELLMEDNEEACVTVDTDIMLVEADVE